MINIAEINICTHSWVHFTLPLINCPLIFTEYLMMIFIPFPTVLMVRFSSILFDNSCYLPPKSFNYSSQIMVCKLLNIEEKHVILLRKNSNLLRLLLKCLTCVEWYISCLVIFLVLDSILLPKYVPRTHLGQFWIVYQYWFVVNLNSHYLMQFMVVSR